MAAGGWGGGAGAGGWGVCVVGWGVRRSSCCSVGVGFRAGKVSSIDTQGWWLRGRVPVLIPLAVHLKTVKVGNFKFCV